MKCRWAQSTSSTADTATSESTATCLNSNDEASSSASSASQTIYETLIQTNANNANIQIRDDKRQKLQQPLIDSEDTCSNDAFMFKLNKNEQQSNSDRILEIFPSVK